MGSEPKGPPSGSRTQYGIPAPNVTPAPPLVSRAPAAVGTPIPPAQQRVLATRLSTPVPAQQGAAQIKTPAPQLRPGMQLHQYELIRELGRGGMGVVFAARDTRLGRRVAIKFLLDATREVAERFLIEARATAQCNHENIVIIHEVDEFAGVPYMVLEFLEGQSLRDVMGAFSGGHKMSPSRTVEIALPIARALSRAHDLGIVHRDLKPENVFVTTAGQVKVLDFGIAKAVNRELAGGPHQGAKFTIPGDASLKTRESALVGTLPYMSPEQMGVDAVDHRSDLWALGVIMFEMLTGRHPVEPLTAHAIVTAAVTDEPVMSVREAAPEVPDQLVRIVDGLLRKRKVERISSASGLARQLEEMLPGRGGRQLAEGESPYPGLTAFQEQDADRFFGRSRDVARMVARVRENPLTGVVGPSGVGKSSFVRAGVGPALKASGEHWEVVTLRPGRQPMSALASVVQRLTTRSGASIEGTIQEHEGLLYRLRTEPGYLGTLLRGRAQQTQGHILLFVDQFEELYTLVPDPAERRAFTAALAGVADDTTTPLRVVVSMRSDFLDRIAEDPRFMEELSRGLVFLTPPDRAGLREALVQPVEMVGHRFETPAMIEDMLDALGATPGALPLLQFAAAKLWDSRDRQQRLLTQASYQQIGGISGALATHADDVVANMNAPAQKLTQKMFRRLVTPERTRAIIEIADLYQLSPDHGETARVLDLLVAARLLVIQTRGDGGGGTVEIVHESLIDRWPTLRRWLDEDQEDAAFVAQLAQTAKQWEAKGRPSGLLWRGDAMEEARRWYALRPRELTPRDQAFVDAVFALARRGKRARRALLTVAFIVLGAVAAGAMIAFVWIRGAEQTATDQAAKATDALAKMKQKEAERKAAEDQRIAAEKQQATLESQKAVVEKEKQVAETQVKLSRDDLEKANSELRKEVDEVKSAKERAEAATKKAQDAAAAVAKANAELQAVHERDAARIKELQNEKLTKTLK